MSNHKAQKTIGNNPLEQYLSTPKEVVKEEAKISAASVSEIKKEIPFSGHASKKQRITLHLSSELLEKIKNAVFWEPGLTIAGVAEDALTHALEKLEKKRGETYPARKEIKLRAGRPMK